ncbi:RNA 3'-terminal phosphate cyclase-domain-containing protein [Pseudomassariella vexata]|uniref:RNA 3'-terminal phosphate cyclase-domain-containing protein n=1 Tax=Pseudomassariella vexata TaxID=1141098 RepID=A0A1Y2DMI2_9PEZI|nr:RNA 3'-terminal phosphate cyclase-domain-containing protein [Pseudomassariella vexata]ORY60503.1 RNA 3'-terminal phosphate cyclase-domain-containing protein [Pseudomassariella vexata]
MRSQRPIEIDGRTGEGGGQLVRIAAALAAVTSQPILITRVRGNRAGHRGGGLKAQHVSSLRWLAKATGAEVAGLSVGSHTLEFCPSAPPTALKERNIQIASESSAPSTLLIFQAVLPYLLFASNDAGEPIELEIHGGTNVSFSLSYEYLDQVLLPTLKDKFGITVERQLRKRGWSSGPQQRGCVWFEIHPIPRGQSLKLKEPWDKPTTAADLQRKHIDVSIVAPHSMHEPLQTSLAQDLNVLFPDIDIQFVVVEDSGHDARMYVFLVAHSRTGLRWGRDWLYNASRRRKTAAELGAEMSRKVAKDLYGEIAVRGVVDEYLQDQLVVFQVLAEGRSSFPRVEEPVDGDVGVVADDGDGDDLAIGKLRIGGRRMKKDRADEPFGEGSMHTTTARWVASELLPGLKWYDKGSVCEGIGISFE